MFFIKEERGFIMSSIDSAIDLNAGSVSENVKTTLRGEPVSYTHLPTMSGSRILDVESSGSTAG